MKDNNNSHGGPNNNLMSKGVIIPIIFAVIATIIFVIATTPAIGLFPSGNHYDSLTTTAPTQTTEYVANEYVQG